MSKVSMKSIRASLNGKRVMRTVEGLTTIEDIDTLRQAILDLLAKNNIPAEQLQEGDNRFFLKDGPNFWMKPKLKKVAFGKVFFRSADYIFEDEDRLEDGKPQQSFGDLSGTIALDTANGFIKPVNNGNAQGTITYTLVD